MSHKGGEGVKTSDDLVRPWSEVTCRGQRNPGRTLRKMQLKRRADRHSIQEEYWDKEGGRQKGDEFVNGVNEGE